MNTARTFLRVYLIVYYGLLIGAGGTLWRADLLSNVQTVWVVAVGMGAIGLGVLLWVVSRGRKREGRSLTDDPPRGDEASSNDC